MKQLIPKFLHPSGTLQYNRELSSSKTNTWTNLSKFPENSEPQSAKPNTTLISKNPIKKQSPRRVDFLEFTKDVSMNNNRRTNPVHGELFLDSLIARGYREPQRLAILATYAQEADERGAATRGIGGNGMMGLNEQRMPLSYLGSTPEKVGEQINYILNDLETTHSDNWLDGGTGEPYIKNGKDGFNQFWSATDPYQATLILNKSYIRPRDRVGAWNNRAKVSSNMQKFMK